MESINPMTGQIAFLTVALISFVVPALAQFRWRAPATGTNTSFYNDWTTSTKLGSNNYWELSNMVYNYGMIAIWGVAVVTQLMSIFGVMPEINILVWSYVVGTGGLFISISYWFMALIGI